jgi:hypothetical protein
MPSLADHFWWRPFDGRHIQIFCLSEDEHKIRDAKTLLCLQEFFLTRGRRCCIVPISIKRGLAEDRFRAAAKEGNGIVFVGRPSLFGTWGEELPTKLFPRLHWGFGSKTVKHPDYRRITGPDFFEPAVPSFAEQRNSARVSEIRPVTLRDKAFFYFGRHEDVPVAWLSGTSTVGTWGSASFATQDLNEAGYSDELAQGLLNVEVQDTGDVFGSVKVKRGKMLSPCRVWMSGNDLPSPQQWKGIKPKARAEDLQIFVNGKRVRSSTNKYTQALCFAAWLNAGDVETQKYGGYVQCTSVGALAWITEVTGATGKDRLTKADVSSELTRLLGEIADLGGIVFSEKTPGHRGKGQPPSIFTICINGLPSFLRTERK